METTSHFTIPHLFIRHFSAKKIWHVDYWGGNFLSILHWNLRRKARDDFEKKEVGDPLPGNPGVVPTASWRSERSGWRFNTTVDGWNPVNSPVEVGSLSHYLQGFSTILGFLLSTNKNQFQFLGHGNCGDFCSFNIRIIHLCGGGCKHFEPQAVGSSLTWRFKAYKNGDKEYVKRWNGQSLLWKNDHFVDKMVEPH